MYRPTEEKFGSHDKIAVESSNVKFAFCLTGATPLSLEFKKGEKFLPVIDGYQTPEEFDSGSGSRNWIMTPFANRVADNKYAFRGTEYHLVPVPPKQKVIHGFTSMEKFEMINMRHEFDSLIIRLKNSSIRKGRFEGYPFDADVFVDFKLSNDLLSIKVSGHNISNEPIPFWSGWHPYFKTCEEGIEHLRLMLKASSIILMDSNFIPLPGDDAYSEISLHPDYDLRPAENINTKTISGKVFDLCYADLTANADGRFSTTIIDDKNKISLRVFQNKGVALIFSGDSLLERKRKSIAVEPMQCLTNGFNRREFENDITILPGDTKSFEFGVELLCRH